MNGSRFVAAISIVMLTGCSGHLSRSKVDSEMRQQYQCPNDACFPGFGGQELFLTIGKVTGSCNGVTDYDPVQSDYRCEYKALSQAGYITIKPEKRTLSGRYPKNRAGRSPEIGPDGTQVQNRA